MEKRPAFFIPSSKISNPQLSEAGLDEFICHVPFGPIKKKARPIALSFLFFLTTGSKCIFLYEMSDQPVKPFQGGVAACVQSNLLKEYESG